MGITHVEASFLFSLSMERMHKFMARYGRHYPVLFVLKKGEPVDLSFLQNESIVSVDAEEKNPGDTPDTIYRSAVGFKMEDDNDEVQVQAVADEIARSVDPDAMCLVIPCLYAEYEDENAKIPATLQDEPEAFTVLHVCYWLREDPTAYITQSPFHIEGSGTEETVEHDAAPENEVNYGVVVVSYPWTKETERFRPKILNPYRSE